MNSKKNLLVIGAGPAQRTGILTAKRLGYAVTAIDGDSNAIGLADADDHHVMDVKDCDAIVELAKTLNVDGVATIATDICLPAVAAVREALDLPGLTKTQVVAATDKSDMRRRFSAAGIECPKFAVFKPSDDARAAAEKVGFPAVLKPADNSGSRGVSLVESMDGLEKAVDAAKPYARKGNLIIESFMPGPEIAVDGFVLNGELIVFTISDKTRTPFPYLLDITVTFPSRKDSRTITAIIDLAKRCVKALELDDCPIHMEQIVSPDGPRVVECAARGPGFKVFTDMIPRVSRVNPVELQIRLAMGETVAAPIIDLENLNGACVWFLSTDRDGVIEAIEGVDAAKSVPHVDEVVVYVKPGDAARALTSGQDRIGHVISYAPDANAAFDAARTAAGLIKIQCR